MLKYFLWIDDGVSEGITLNDIEERFSQRLNECSRARDIFNLWEKKTYYFDLKYPDRSETQEYCLESMEASC